MGEWELQAACRGEDPEMWFPSPSESEKLAAAKNVCLACPVRVECLEAALRVNEEHGVWGGMSRSERRELAARRRREERAS